MIQRLIGGLALFVVVLASVSVFAQAPTQFSADTKFSSKAGFSGNGKLYVDGHKVRMETSTPQGQSITISDNTRKVAYVLMPAQHMYMEMSTEMKAAKKPGPEWKMYDPANPCANILDTTCQKIGPGIADGKMCDKWQFVRKKGPSQTVWIEQKRGIPIRTETSDGTIFELLNIKEGPQGASLFEVPAGYQKLDMGNMMKGLGGMMKQD